MQAPVVCNGKKGAGRGLCTKYFQYCICLSVFQSTEIFYVEKLYESFVFKGKERADLYFTQVWISFSFQEIILNLSIDYKAKGI